MPIWGEIDLFCQAIFEEGHKETDDILKQANAEAERIVAEAQREAEKAFDKQILAQKSNAYGEAKRIVDAAELEAGKRIIAFREQVMREIFNALKERLKAVRNQPGYPDLLLAQIKEGIAALPGKAFIVEVKTDDLALLNERLENLAGELGFKIEAETSASIEGGARIYTGDRRLLYDNSFLARLKRREDEIRREIWRKIFGTERGEQ